jgi:alkylation response protein AidB-like acyl-CoA dehydrogenase
MTFDLSSPQLEMREAARAFARDRVAPLAVSVDERGEVPEDLLRDGATLVARAPEALASTLVIEEIAAASGSVAAAVVIGADRDELPGLRGARRVANGQLDARLRALVSAVALGIGRAALDAAIDVFRKSDARPHGLAEERPHWVLADAATELDAARLLVWRGAHGLTVGGVAEADLALAQTLAVGAAERAVAAALRIAGADVYKRGALLERLSRDARTLTLVGGTEEDHRLVAARTLPQ